MTLDIVQYCIEQKKDYVKYGSMRLTKDVPNLTRHSWDMGSLLQVVWKNEPQDIENSQ